MTNPLPKWLFLRYAKLWKEKKNQNFDFDEARRLLKEKDDKTVSVILSDLRKHGWLKTFLDPNDARKRTYQLKSPQDIVEEIALGDT
ncbi:MAG: hypothetical protein QXL57_04915 [Candidatus Bathyarchaeia archaeon]